MKDEKVSIIIPTYNRAYILNRAIDSVLAQTYDNFELIIVDDGSNDNTAELVAGYNDSRVKYCYTKINKGAAAARNYGISKSSCNIIAFEDSDDYWHPDKLEKQMKLLKEDASMGFVYSKIEYTINGGGKAVLPDEKLSLEKKSGNIYSQLLYDNLVDCPSMVIRKECLDKVGVFDESLKALEDYDLALRLAKEYSAGFVNEVLVDSTFSLEGVSLNAVNYLNASCMLIYKYKKDYLKTGNLNHRLEIILRDAERIGATEQYVALLEKIMVS